jgi:hypothetical protein
MRVSQIYDSDEGEAWTGTRFQSGAKMLVVTLRTADVYVTAHNGLTHYGIALPVSGVQALVDTLQEMLAVLQAEAEL